MSKIYKTQRNNKRALASALLCAAALSSVCSFAAMAAGGAKLQALTDASAPEFVMNDTAQKSVDAYFKKANGNSQKSAAVGLQKVHPQVLRQLAASAVAATAATAATAVTIDATKSKAEPSVEVLVHLSDTAFLETMKNSQSMGTVTQNLSTMGAAVVRVNSAQLAQLNAQTAVISIRPTNERTAGYFAGSAVTEGDVLHRAKSARSRFNVAGSGQSVCVISDGVDNIASAKATGDLPATVEVCADSPGSGDEGTAMLEIVHDLAPGAALAFCSARGSFFNAVLWSATKAFAGKGCDVIVDDTYNLSEPRLQLSDETTLMNAVRAELGKTVVTSAGNLADSHYRKPFINADYSGTTPNAGFHDFGRSLGRASSIGFPVAVAPGGEAILTLQWSEAYGKAASDFVLIPVLPDGSPIDSAGSPFTVPADISDNVQDGKGVPFEALVVSNTSATQQNFFVLIQRKTGNSFVDLSLVQVASGQSGFFPSFRVRAGSVIAHSGAEQALSVAAVNAADPGLDEIRPYSSFGPVITQFDNNGNRKFDIQFKPDITAVDGVSVTGAGGFGGPEKRFGGTSASAPHVAGVAALLRAKVANVDVESSLLFSAQPRGSFLTWGAGVMDAEHALEIAPYFIESSGNKRATADGKAAAAVAAAATISTEAFAEKTLNAVRASVARDAQSYSSTR